MKVESGRPSLHATAFFAKAAYSRSARKKLVASRVKLEGVRAGIKRADAAGRLQPSEKLKCAERAMETRFASAKSRLEMLQKADDEGWEELRDELENAWDDLSQSINKLVARLKDESS